MATIEHAPWLDRWVESLLTIGERVGVGQRLGMIRLDSLVGVIVPQGDDVRIDARPGERVTAGVSVLARYVVNGERTED